MCDCFGIQVNSCKLPVEHIVVTLPSEVDVVPVARPPRVDCFTRLNDSSSPAVYYIGKLEEKNPLQPGFQPYLPIPFSTPIKATRTLLKSHEPQTNKGPLTII